MSHESRIARLEKRNRWMVLVTIGSLITVVFVACERQSVSPTSKTVAAKKQNWKNFTKHDSLVVETLYVTGKIEVTNQAFSKGDQAVTIRNTGLIIFDPEGDSSVSLSGSRGDASLFIHDGKGASIEITGASIGSQVKGKGSARMGVSKLVTKKTGDETKTAPTFIVFDKNGTVRWRADE